MMRTAAVLLMGLFFANSGWTEERSRVVRLRDPGTVTLGEFDAGRVRALVSQGIQALTGQASDGAAWATLVGSNDVVGIKVTTQAAPLQSTRVAVVEAIAAGLRAAGVTGTNIIVWDRDVAKLRAAGFIGSTNYQVRAVVGDTGWDAEQFYESRMVGKLIWGDRMHGDEAEEEYTSRSHLPKVLTQTLTKWINAPALQDHEGCGLSGCLFNATVGMVDNSRRFEVAGSRSDLDIVQMAALPAIHSKMILQVLDSLVVGYAGGPSFKQRFSFSPGTLYMSRDPVAVDALALAEVEAQRAAAQVPPIGERAGHITTAARVKLGMAEREQIELIEPAVATQRAP